MNRVSLKAFLVGNVADVALSILTAIFFVTYANAKTHHPGMTPTQSLAVAAAFRSSTTWRIVRYSVGFACSLLAGYIGGRVAEHSKTLNGLLSSTFCVMLGLLILARGQSRENPAIQIAVALAAAGLAALGGWIAERTAHA